MPIEPIPSSMVVTGQTNAKQVKQTASPPPPPVDRVTLSGSAKGIPASRTSMEADLSMVGDAQGISANGQFRIDQAVVERLIRNGLKGNQKLVNAQVSYLPGENAYVIKGKLSVTGPDLPLTIKLALDVEQDRLTLRFKEVEGLGPNSWYEERVVKEFAFGLRSQGLGCDDHPQEKKILFRTNDLLRSAGALPDFVTLNTATTKMNLTTDQAGNLTFGLRSDQSGPSVDATQASDLALHLKPDGLKSALARMLAPDYKVEDIQLSAGQVQITGKARWRGLEAGVSTLKLLGVLMGERSAYQGNLSGGTAWAPVNLSIRLAGDRLVIRPDMAQAVSGLHEALTKRRTAHQMEKDGVSIAIQDLFPGGAGHFTYLELNEKGLVAKAHVNADAIP